MKEVLTHLRALVYEFRIKDDWSHHNPLVQRIINYTSDGSIGTQPACVIFGDMIDSDLAMDLYRRAPQPKILKESKKKRGGWWPK